MFLDRTVKFFFRGTQPCSVIAQSFANKYHISLANMQVSHKIRHMLIIFTFLSAYFAVVIYTLLLLWGQKAVTVNFRMYVIKYQVVITITFIIINILYVPYSSSFDGCDHIHNCYLRMTWVAWAVLLPLVATIDLNKLNLANRCS